MRQLSRTGAFTVLSGILGACVRTLHSFLLVFLFHLIKYLHPTYLLHLRLFRRRVLLLLAYLILAKSACLSLLAENQNHLECS